MMNKKATLSLSFRITCAVNLLMVTVSVVLGVSLFPRLFSGDDSAELGISLFPHMVVTTV